MAEQLTDDELVELGLCDADKRDGDRIPFIRMLFERGATLEDVQAAAAGGQSHLSALALELVCTPPNGTPVPEVAQRLGLSEQQIAQIWFELGLPDPLRKGVLLSDGEVELASLVFDVSRFLADDIMRQVVPSLGSSVNDIAQTVAHAFRIGLEEPLRAVSTSEVVIASTYSELSDWIARFATAFDALFRRQVVAAAYERVAVTGGTVYGDRTIVFVDLVDYTGLSSRSTGPELAAVLRTFEEMTIDVANRFNGRRVKLLGDGAMLRFDSRSDGIDAALELVTQHANAPSSRAGVATGPVIIRNGDLFGPVVNLASRLAGVIAAREVAVDDSTPVDNAERMAAVRLKGIDEPATYYRLTT